MILTTSTDQKIKQILDHCGYLSPGPIDLEDICRSYGIRIILYQEYHAAYRAVKGEPRMYIPKEPQDYFSLRYEIAHELGHYFRHVGIQTIVREDFAQYLEGQADNFAERFLVPTHLLCQLDLPDDLQTAIGLIAETFDVDIDLAEKRLRIYLNHLFIQESDDQLQTILNKRFLYTYLGYYWRHDPVDTNTVYLYCKGKGFIRKLYVEGCYS